MHDESSPYFSTPDLAGLLQQLKHLCLFSADALVVEAEHGSGKSSFKSELIHSLESEELDVRIRIASFDCAPDQMLSESLSQVALDFGIQTEEQSAGALISQLRSLSHSLAAEKVPCVLVVDDAHFMEDDLLGALLSLLEPNLNEPSGLRIVFLAEPGLMARIDQIAGPELSVYDFQLASFSSAELERFLSQRVSNFDELQASGALPSSANIWSRSGGRPGVALSIVESLLEKPSSSQEGRAGFLGGMPVMHLGLLSILLAGLILTLLYRGGEEVASTSSPERQVLAPDSILSAGAPDPQAATIIEHPQGELKEELEADSGGEAEADQVEKNPVNTLVADRAEPKSGEAPEASGNDLIVSQAEVVAEEPSQQESTREEVTSADELGSSRADEPAAEKPEAEERLTASEQKLLQARNSAYVLQLVALSKEESAESYIAQQENKSSLLIYRRKKRDGGNLFIVVSGPYLNKADAQSAMSLLPKRQREAGAWPKSIGAVRTEIEAFSRR